MTTVPTLIAEARKLVVDLDALTAKLRSLPFEERQELFRALVAGAANDRSADILSPVTRTGWHATYTPGLYRSAGVRGDKVWLGQTVSRDPVIVDALMPLMSR